MNYQASFSQGTSAASGITLDQLRWVALKPQANPPGSQADGEGPPMPLLWRGTRASDRQGQSARERIGMSDESRRPPPSPADRDGARREGAEPTPEQPRRRVPDSDIIYVGPRPARSAAPEPVDSGPPVSQEPPARRRNLVPPLLALLIFEIVVSGGIYARNRYAEAQVIVVPATTSERSVIT